jgi:hypothetical protein
MTAILLSIDDTTLDVARRERRGEFRTAPPLDFWKFVGGAVTRVSAGG